VVPVRGLPGDRHQPKRLIAITETGDRLPSKWVIDINRNG
jgi:hypothetical protein